MAFAAAVLAIFAAFVPAQAFASRFNCRRNSMSSECLNRRSERRFKDVYPWLSSAEQIRDGFRKLVGHCAGADVEMSQRMAKGDSAHEPPALDVVRIRRSGSQPKTKGMFVFGVHAREIISPESALHFARALCGHGESAALLEGGRSEAASRVLNSVEFIIVPNANPLGRKWVEKGHFCKRTNGNGVDLNRNFGNDHRNESLEVRNTENNPGPRGFSEPESRILKDLIDAERPDIYLSVHTGAYLLGTPFGYTQREAPGVPSDTHEILRHISDKYCASECPYGTLANLIHYDSPGCDVDYVSQHAGTQYAFTWEIYAGETFRRRYVDEAHQRNQGGGSLLQRSGRQRFQETLDGGELAAYDEDDSCSLDQFTPPTAEETTRVIENWTSAYIELSEAVSERQASRVTSSAEGGA